MRFLKMLFVVVAVIASAACSGSGSAGPSQLPTPSPDPTPSTNPKRVVLHPGSSVANDTAPGHCGGVTVAVVGLVSGNATNPDVAGRVDAEISWTPGSVSTVALYLFAQHGDQNTPGCDYVRGGSCLGQKALAEEIKATESPKSLLYARKAGGPPSVFLLYCNVSTSTVAVKVEGMGFTPD